MANEGINWEARIGKPIDKITVDDKLTVIVSVLDSLREDVKPLSATCKTVERHKVYWVIAGWLGGTFGIGVITVLIKLLFHI